ncbi:MAG: biotin--[acetyl-CoA-carboxylase] ligase, partial [Pikeienuella sp.]
MADWPQGVGFVRLGTVDSTNEEARRRAEAGEAGPLWIMADQQTGGRGRQGRAWEPVMGNLFATLLIKPKTRAADAARLSFAACLAVGDLLEAEGCTAQMKWPNDPLLNGGKVAGVLLEGSGAGDRLDWLAIGIGVNLADCPPGEPDAAHPPTSLRAATGRLVSTEDALTVIAASLHKWEMVLARDGFGPLRDAWLSRAVKIGETITARLPGKSLTGVFEDVDETGALILRAKGVRHQIHAADIFFA